MKDLLSTIPLIKFHAKYEFFLFQGGLELKRCLKEA